uniref:FLZ-type domain-containing protein n=2 Tax=Cajanus cajan TaxID=3821 RepID=A0A151T2R3_CAJCA|nr:hypothetical protein KK1_015849 [Cajanus cajan]
MENYNSNSRNRMILERGVVGLGIVAAMSMSKTNVVSSAKPAANFRGIFYASPLTPHFLTSCNLCDKHLHGVDIFIYRGEKAFCSAQCRETHIRNDGDHQHKYRSRSRVMKPLVHNAVRLTSPHPILAA